MAVNNFIRFHLPAMLWAAVVFILTLLPAASLPETPDWKFLSFDSLAHLIVFGVLTLLLIRSFYFSYGKPRFLKFALLVSAIICMFFGVIIELLQTVMNLGRHGEVGDVISDFAGILLGVIAGHYLFRKRAAF